MKNEDHVKTRSYWGEVTALPRYVNPPQAEDPDEPIWVDAHAVNEIVRAAQTEINALRAQVSCVRWPTDAVGEASPLEGPPFVEMIVARDVKGVIGRNNLLPWHIPQDLAWFRSNTIGKTLIMGRKTYESIGRPLPNRNTVVITTRTDWNPHPDVITAPSLTAALVNALALGDPIVIAGGSQVYRDALPYVKRLYITEVNMDVEDGDAFFPEIDYTDWRANTVASVVDGDALICTHMSLYRIR